MTDHLLSAANAGERLAKLLQQLDQSARPADFRQLREGLHTEARLIRYHLRGLQEAAQETAAAVLADSPGLVRSDAPATSRAAARHVAVRSGTQRGNVLMYLYRACAATDYEIQADLGLAPSSERPRRGELVSMGLVTATDQTRRHGGEDWTVWTLTRMGEGVARQIGNGANTVQLNDIADVPVSQSDEQSGDPVLF